MTNIQKEKVEKDDSEYFIRSVMVLAGRLHCY